MYVCMYVRLFEHKFIRLYSQLSLIIIGLKNDISHGIYTSGQKYKTTLKNEEKYIVYNF